jgi:hypothetical protein
MRRNTMENSLEALERQIRELVKAHKAWANPKDRRMVKHALKGNIEYSLKEAKFWLGVFEEDWREKFPQIPERPTYTEICAPRFLDKIFG